MVIWHDQIFSLTLYDFFLFVVGIMGIYTYLDGGRVSYVLVLLFRTGEKEEREKVLWNEMGWFHRRRFCIPLTYLQVAGMKTLPASRFDH